MAKIISRDDHLQAERVGVEYLSTRVSGHVVLWTSDRLTLQRFGGQKYMSIKTDQITQVISFDR
jgi:hypothetical protein